MNLLKISLLVFIFSITISAQEGCPDLTQKSNPSDIILLLKSTDYLIVDSVWQEDSRITYNYTPATLLLESKLYEVNNSGNWENERLVKYFYQASYQPYEVLELDWDGYNWENQWRTYYTYNQLSQIEIKLTEAWGLEHWGKNDSSVFIYNAFDSLNYIHSYRWNEEENWENVSWQSYAYNVGGYLEERIIKSWSEFYNQWINAFRFTFFYNNNYQVADKIYDLWIDSNWVKQTKTEFIYDTLGYGYLTERYLFEWDGNDWIESKKFTYDYDFFNLLHQLTEFNWNGNEWENYKKTIYERIIVGVVDELNLVQHFKLLQNYPNPFNPSTKIKFTIPSVETGYIPSLQTTLKVYDVLGNEIETLVNEEKQTGTYELTWYAENLPSGIYFYQLKAGSFIQTKKMILIK